LSIKQLIVSPLRPSPGSKESMGAKIHGVQVSESLKYQILAL
jgi:hypothetical protein